MYAVTHVLHLFFPLCLLCVFCYFCKVIVFLFGLIILMCLRIMIAFKNILLLVLFYLVFAYFARIFLNCSFANTISRPIFFHCIICFIIACLYAFIHTTPVRKSLQYADRNNLILFSAICYPTSIMYSHAFIVKFHRIC